jgi:hypothetical protein
MYSYSVNGTCTQRNNNNYIQENFADTLAETTLAQTIPAADSEQAIKQAILLANNLITNLESKLQLNSITLEQTSQIIQQLHTIPIQLIVRGALDQVSELINYLQMTIKNEPLKIDQAFQNVTDVLPILRNNIDPIELIFHRVLNLVAQQVAQQAAQQVAQQVAQQAALSAMQIVQNDAVGKLKQQTIALENLLKQNRATLLQTPVSARPAKQLQLQPLMQQQQALYQQALYQKEGVELVVQKVQQSMAQAPTQAPYVLSTYLNGKM